MPKRTLRMMSALPPYLGGKRGLLAQIFREVARHIDPSRWKQCSFVDAFSGGGSVSLYAKAQFREVLSNDLSDRAAMVAHAILVNNRVRLTRTDGVLLLAGADSPTNYAASLKEWFEPATARVIDRGLAYAATVADPAKAALLRLQVWRMVNNARPTSADFTSRDLVERALTGELKISGIVGAKYAFRAPNIDDVERMIEATNCGIFGGVCAFTQADALEASAGWGADVVYLDPPYAGDVTYERYYHMADCVMAQAALAQDGPSPFSDRKSAEAALVTLVGNVAAAGAKLVLLHNSDSAVPRERTLGIMAEHFEAFEVPVTHKHFAAGAHGHDGEASGTAEVFVVGKARG